MCINEAFRIVCHDTDCPLCLYPNQPAPPGWQHNRKQPMTPSTCQTRSPTQRDQLEPVAPIAKPDGCQGTNCASVNGLNHSRECITEAAATQGWTPTAEDFSASELSASAKEDQRIESGMTFGAAIEALKVGQSVARAGWNGKGMFVYLVPAASYPVQTGAAKAYFGKDALVPYAAYLALKNVDGTVNTWAPSVSDALAEDWALAP